MSGPSLGQIIRDLRYRNGWTLKGMSDRSGIPVSTLSKVENGRLTLTYEKLEQLSRRLNIRMSDLFAEGRSKIEEITARRSIGRIEDAVRVETDNYDYFYLCPELRHKRMIPILTRISAKSLDEFGDLVRHNGEEYVHVLEGNIVVHTEFYDPIALDTGEGIYIDSNMGHAYIAGPDCAEAVVLGVCSADDDALIHSLMNLHDQEARPARLGADDEPAPRVRRLATPKG